MKKEFSFYEFVGIFVPAVILLYCGQLIYEHIHQKQIVDFSKIGETVIFAVVCYGIGHIIQALGNIFESFLWFIYGGKPTKWLSNKNRFGNFLFDDVQNQKIFDKVKQKYGDGIKDYGRLVYNFNFQKEKTARIDIFNGNYSLFRGLTISFLILSIICGYYFDWEMTLVSTVPFVLSLMRMIRFAKYYATETFRTFFNLTE
jgi:hypothetical protein